MKNLTKVVTAFVIVFSAASPSAFAVTTSLPATQISATVDTVLSLGMTIKEETSPSPLTFGPAVTSMDHGTLIRSNDVTTGAPNALRGKAFHVWLGANTSGRPYTITSTMNAMTSGANTLPHALGVFGADALKGDGTSAGGTLVSTAGVDAVGTGKLLYTSSAAAPAATIQLVYGLSGGLAGGGSPFTGWVPVPPDQAPGTYSTTVTFTLTA